LGEGTLAGLYKQEQRKPGDPDRQPANKGREDCCAKVRLCEQGYLALQGNHGEAVGRDSRTAVQ